MWGKPTPRPDTGVRAEAARGGAAGDLNCRSRRSAGSRASPSTGRPTASPRRRTPPPGDRQARPCGAGRRCDPGRRTQPAGPPGPLDVRVPPTAVRGLVGRGPVIGAAHHRSARRLRHVTALRRRQRGLWQETAAYPSFAVVDTTSPAPVGNLHPRRHRHPDGRLRQPPAHRPRHAAALAAARGVTPGLMGPAGEIQPLLTAATEVTGTSTTGPLHSRHAPARQPAGRDVPMSRLRQVEAVQHHHLVPGGDEVSDELRLGVVAGVDLGECPQLGVGAEDQVDRGCRSSAARPAHGHGPRSCLRRRRSSTTASPCRGG